MCGTAAALLIYYESKKKKGSAFGGPSSQTDERIGRKLDWGTQTHSPMVKILRLKSLKFSLEILAGNHISLVYLFLKLVLYSKGIDVP